MFKHLIEQGLVKEKKYPNGLSVFKYSRKVFYDALWNTDPLLLEARGMVLDSDGNKVIWPFTKVFNHHENNTDLDLGTVVVAPRKVNGFMAAARYWKGELIISTTGTLDSDFAKLAREHIEALPEFEFVNGLATNYTLMFEICDLSDPHIIEEEAGAYLIGARDMVTGQMLTEGHLDIMSRACGAKRPAIFHGAFRDVLNLLQDCKHEGYMVRLATPDQPTIMKLKSPYYLTKKFIMRMSEKKVDYLFDSTAEFKQNADEEFYSVIDYIVTTHTKEAWKAMSDQDRRKIVESYFENQ